MAEQSSVNCISRLESTEAKFVKKDFSRAFSSRKDIYISLCVYDRYIMEINLILGTINRVSSFLFFSSFNLVFKKR